jgi:hypothetical protein
MNHFVALSKCLPGLVGIIEPDEDKPEHQLILDMRHRIIASMNKLLDDMKLPSSLPNKQGECNVSVTVSVQEASTLVSEMIKIFTRETEQLRGVVLPQASTKRVTEIKTAIDTFAQQVKEQFEAAYFQKFTEKNVQAHEKSMQARREQTPNSIKWTPRLAEEYLLGCFQYAKDAGVRAYCRVKLNDDCFCTTDGKRMWLVLNPIADATKLKEMCDAQFNFRSLDRCLHSIRVKNVELANAVESATVQSIDAALAVLQVRADRRKLLAKLCVVADACKSTDLDMVPFNSEGDIGFNSREAFKALKAAIELITPLCHDDYPVLADDALGGEATEKAWQIALQMSNW